MARSKIRRLALTGLVVIGTGVTAAPAQAAPSCRITWGSTVKQAGSLRTTPYLSARTGQHPCFDRLVLELHGPAGGYRVGYVPSLAAEGSGAVIPVTGGAVLQIVLLDPDQASSSRPPGSRLANVSGYRTFRDVVHGGSFEGYTDFGVGVRAVLPFRVFVLPGPGTDSRVVVDVAHHW